MTLRFPNASHVEHIDTYRLPVDGFDDPDLACVRWWWEDCVGIQRGALPSTEQTDRLIAEPDLRDNLLLVDCIDDDPFCRVAGKTVNAVTGQTVSGVRISRFGMPESDRRMFRRIYRDIATARRPAGLGGAFRINTAPAGAFTLGFFPVTSRHTSEAAILVALMSTPYQPPTIEDNDR